VINRLEAIEALLGIGASSQQNVEDDVGFGLSGSGDLFLGVWTAAAHLKTITRPPQTSQIWSRAVIKQLWLS